MGQIFDNSKIRDNNRDHREWREFFMFFCPYVFFKTAKKRDFFVLMSLCSYVLTTANGASGGATKPHP